MAFADCIACAGMLQQQGVEMTVSCTTPWMYQHACHAVAGTCSTAKVKERVVRQHMQPRHTDRHPQLIALLHNAYPDV